MTGDQARALLERYRQVLFQRRHEHGNTSYELYLQCFCLRAQELVAPSKEGKLMRWLGFVQGALWRAGIYTVDELKEHSRNASEGKGNGSQ